LSSKEIQDVVEILKSNQSTYLASFTNLKEEVQKAKVEAEDN
jgi:hypothetical protein